MSDREDPRWLSAELFKKEFFFHGTDRRGAEEIRKAGRLRAGASVSPSYAVAHSFASTPGGKLTGGYNEGHGSVFAVHRHHVWDAETKVVLQEADRLKATGMSEDEAVQAAYDSQQGVNEHLPTGERILGADVGPLHEIPHHKAKTAEEAHAYLTGRRA